jgi:hypothetical protein
MATKRRIPTTAALVVLSSLWLHEPAFAQAKRGDPVVAAQQALARLDYASAFRFALEALRADPKNLDVRRIAARSAKELQRPADCLRLMQPVQPAVATADDVGLVGDCASSSQFTPWSLSFLQQSTAQSANADMANFWLGKFYYRKGDYARADAFLGKVTVLPARLEKERQFLLERARDVLEAQQSPPSPSAGTAGAGTAGDASKGSGSALPSSPAPARPSPAASAASWPSAQKLTAERPAVLRRNAAAGWFKSPLAEVSVGLSVYQGKAIELDPNSQEGYDKAIVSGKPAEAVPAIKERKLALTDFTVDTVFGGTFGLNSALTPGGGQSRVGLDVLVGATQSGRELPVYALRGETLPAQVSPRTAHSGWGLTLGPVVDLATNRNFSLGAKALYGVSGPSFGSPLGRLEGSAYARIEFDQADVRSGGRFGWWLGSDNKQGAQIMSFDFDARVGRLGLFGFGAPEGYPLFRYSRLVPTGSSAVSLFTQLEGDFYELNLAPRLFLGEQIAALFWYRYVSGSRQSFLGKTVADAVEAQGKAQGKWDPPRPTAEYTSASQDFTFELEWWPLKWLSGAGGVLVRKSVTQYSDKTTLVSQGGIDSFSYAGLLDRGGESWSRYFVEARAAL